MRNDSQENVKRYPWGGRPSRRMTRGDDDSLSPRATTIVHTRPLVCTRRWRRVHGRGQKGSTCIYDGYSMRQRSRLPPPCSPRGIESFKKTCGTTGFCFAASVLPLPLEAVAPQRGNGRSNREETEFVAFCAHTTTSHRQPSNQHHTITHVHPRPIEIQPKHAIKFSGRVPRLIYFDNKIDKIRLFCRSMNSVSQSSQSVRPFYEWSPIPPGLTPAPISPRNMQQIHN